MRLFKFKWDYGTIMLGVLEATLGAICEDFFHDVWISLFGGIGASLFQTKWVRATCALLEVHSPTTATIGDSGNDDDSDGRGGANGVGGDGSDDGDYDDHNGDSDSVSGDDSDDGVGGDYDGDSDDGGGYWGRNATADTVEGSAGVEFPFEP
jgi:hypothetical protein